MTELLCWTALDCTSVPNEVASECKQETTLTYIFPKKTFPCFLNAAKQKTNFIAGKLFSHSGVICRLVSPKFW